MFQLGGPAPSGDSLGGLGDIFGMPTAQSYVPPQEVSTCISSVKVVTKTFKTFRPVEQVVCQNIWAPIHLVCKLIIMQIPLQYNYTVSCISENPVMLN